MALGGGILRKVMRTPHTLNEEFVLEYPPFFLIRRTVLWTCQWVHGGGQCIPIRISSVYGTQYFICLKPKKKKKICD
jgi:hypothetical protein